MASARPALGAPAKDVDLKALLAEKERINDLLHTMTLRWSIECAECHAAEEVLTTPHGMLAAAQLHEKGWTATSEGALCPLCGVL